MTKIHPIAIILALLHFILCSILGWWVWVISAIYGLSDTFRAPPWWFVVMDRLLMVLEAPVVLFLWLLHHPAPSFRPPRLFITDFEYVAPFSTVVGLCVLWSICFGYIAAWVILWFRKRKSKNCRHRIWPVTLESEHEGGGDDYDERNRLPPAARR